MESTDHPIGLNIEEMKAFHAKAWAHVLGVVNLKEVVSEQAHTRWEGMGTGCACLWRNTTLVLTAKHVLEEAQPRDIAFLPRSGTVLRWDQPGQIEGMVERVTIGIERIVRCQWEDLAAIVLAGDGLDRLNIEFCGVPKRLARDQTANGPGSVLIIGYPFDQTFVASEHRQFEGVAKLLACPCDSFWGELVATPEQTLGSDYDPERHLLVRFEPGRHGSRPHGYSGAAVWCDPVRQGPIWTPDPLILGLQTHGYPRAGLIRAVRASSIRSFLEESL